MLSNVNGAKSLTSVKLSSLNIAKSRLRTEVFPDDGGVPIPIPQRVITAHANLMTPHDTQRWLMVVGGGKLN